MSIDPAKLEEQRRAIARRAGEKPTPPPRPEVPPSHRSTYRKDAHPTPGQRAHDQAVNAILRERGVL